MEAMMQAISTFSVGSQRVFPTSTFSAAHPAQASLSFGKMLEARMHADAVSPDAVSKVRHRKEDKCDCCPEMNFDLLFEWIIFMMMLSSANSDGSAFLPLAFFPTLSDLS